MSKMDNLRAMREARYEADRARAGRPAAPPAKAAKAARPAARAQPSAQPPAEQPAEQPAQPVEGRCGHRAISGRTCTREQGHAAKSHRYS